MGFSITDLSTWYGFIGLTGFMNEHCLAVLHHQGMCVHMIRGSIYHPGVLHVLERTRSKQNRYVETSKTGTISSRKANVQHEAMVKASHRRGPSFSSAVFLCHLVHTPYTQMSHHKRSRRCRCRTMQGWPGYCKRRVLASCTCRTEGISRKGLLADIQDKPPDLQ